MKTIFHKKTFIKFSLSVLLLLTLILFPTVITFSTPLSQEGAIYIVQQGDTLNEIELRFGVPAGEIQQANNISNPNELFIGQRLVIPGLEGITGVLTSEVLPFGASLDSLTRRYHLNKEALAYLNKLTSPSETIAGIKFTLPINEDQAPLSPVTSLSEGETLLEAAIKENTSSWVLVENNQFLTTWEVIPGEILFHNENQNGNISVLPGVADVWINPLPLTQGETLQVGISSYSPKNFSGRFNGKILTFFSENEEQYFGFLGTHALTDPGPYPLEITATHTDGTSFTVEQFVMVMPAFFGFETISGIADEYLDQNTIDSENNYLRPIFSQVSEQRHWDGRFNYPVDEPCPSSPFGLNRDYNNGQYFFYHTGLDFTVCAPNLNIYAAASGEVILAEELTIKGKYVLIDHGWGIFSAYAHLSEFNVVAGDFVQARDMIGLIGNTGRSTGPHLHFEIIIVGTYVNPQTWLNNEFPGAVP